MSFDIEQMKQDGVNQHLIDFLSMHPMAAGVSIARRLEHDLLFAQLMTRLLEAGTSLMTFQELAPYAAAAGMISRTDKEWICDDNNIYVEPTRYTVSFDWYIGPAGYMGGHYDLTTGDWIAESLGIEPIQVLAGESIELPDKFQLDYCYDLYSKINNQVEKAQFVGWGAGDGETHTTSFTPTSDVTLYPMFTEAPVQEI